MRAATRTGIAALPAMLCGAAAVLGGAASVAAGNSWGADYFPNVPLTTHEGKVTIPSAIRTRTSSSSPARCW